MTQDDDMAAPRARALTLLTQELADMSGKDRTWLSGRVRLFFAGQRILPLVLKKTFEQWSWTYAEWQVAFIESGKMRQKELGILGPIKRRRNLIVSEKYKREQRTEYMRKYRERKKREAQRQAGSKKHGAEDKP